MENIQKQILVLRAFKGPREPARMRATLEMHTASRMQNIFEFLKKNVYFVTNLFFYIFGKVLLGLSALRASTVGPLAPLFCLGSIFVVP